MKKDMLYSLIVFVLVCLFVYLIFNSLLITENSETVENDLELYESDYPACDWKNGGPYVLSRKNLTSDYYNRIPGEL